MKMLSFLNELLENEVFWSFEEEVNDADIHCEDEKINRYIRKLCDIIEKQRDILEKFRRKISEYQVRLLFHFDDFFDLRSSINHFVL